MMARCHQIWGPVEPKAGAASDESSSADEDADGRQFGCSRPVPSLVSLAAPLEDRLEGIAFHRKRSSSSESQSCSDNLTRDWPVINENPPHVGEKRSQPFQGIEAVSGSSSFSDDDEAGSDKEGAGRMKYVGLDVRLPSYSIGSDEHFEDKCKPCAWYWRAEGCNGGVDCEFCHLCKPGVFQLKTAIRRAERVEDLRAMERKMRSRVPRTAAYNNGFTHPNHHPASRAARLPVFAPHQMPSLHVSRGSSHY
mmetsp:Transcript_54350/g.100360  ORF Transcript_54350/g.100360 Transcript_54350/m.100360 type:complete len:251 (+) Transcript_54350:60-812(+)